MIAVTIPIWFALLIALAILAPVGIEVAALVFAAHFTWTRIYRPHSWKRRNIHLL